MNLFSASAVYGGILVPDIHLSYNCLDLSDNHVDLSDNYVNLSDVLTFHICMPTCKIFYGLVTYSHLNSTYR